jgi:hypothetical protein
MDLWVAISRPFLFLPLQVGNETIILLRGKPENF